MYSGQEGEMEMGSSQEKFHERKEAKPLCVKPKHGPDASSGSCGALCGFNHHTYPIDGCNKNESSGIARDELNAMSGLNASTDVQLAVKGATWGADGGNDGGGGEDEGLTGKIRSLPECVSIDELLRKWVGEFGRAQIIHFTLTSLAWALEALHTLVTVFADRTPAWRCVDYTYISSNGGSNSSVTHYTNSSSTQSSGYGTCTSSSSMCSLAPSLWEWVRKDESTVSQWNLVCGSSYMQGFAQSSFFIGFLLGSGIFGHLSDSRIGRRGALILACMLNAAFGMLTAASPSYGVYTLLRAATGICSGGLGLTSFVLGTELIGPSRRTSVAMSALYFYPLGMFLLAGLATCTSRYSWRILYIVTSALSVLYCILIPPLLAESPRWYLVRGRTEDALHVLQSIAKRNGTIVPAHIALCMHEHGKDNPHEKMPNNNDHHHFNKGIPNPQMPLKPPVIMADLQSSQLDRGAALSTHTYKLSATIPGFYDGHSNIPDTKEASDGSAVTDVAKSIQSKAASGTIMDVFRGRDTRPRMVILIAVWFASALGYYTFNLNVGNLGTNLAISVVLNGLAEVPGYAITAFLLNRMGRRFTLVATLLLTAGSSFMGAMVSYRPTNHYHTSTNYATNMTTFNMSFRSDLLAEANSASLNASSPHSAMSYRQGHGLQVRGAVRLVCGLIGLFSIAGTYNLLFLYTSELFPTVVRNAALGLANQAASAGSVIAPIVAVSAHLNSSLPFFVIGALSLFGGIMAIKLPETLNHPLHDTLEGMRRADSQA